jgi:guanylate kinase
MAETTTAPAGSPNVHLAELLRAHTGSDCVPSRTSIDELQNSDLVLFSGQIVGAGKSTLIQAQETNGSVNIPSWTNRDLRLGEIAGVDKVQATLGVMAERAITGYFLELEEVRPGVFYATPSEFAPGKKYTKDLELKGAMRLRSFAPVIPIVIPLPPLSPAIDGRSTVWERRLVQRERLHESITDKATDDLESRLIGVVEEAERIEDLGLIDDPHTLLVINDDFARTHAAVEDFLATGKKGYQLDIVQHVRKLKDLAALALDSL